MPAERDMSELVVQYMDKNNMYCMEGHRGVRSFEQIATMLGYNDRFNTSTLHAFLEDNSGCLDAMVEWIKTQRNPEWKAAIESVIEEPKDDPDDEDQEDLEEIQEAKPADARLEGELEDWTILANIPN